jgi:hypothetical protein
VDDRTKGPIRTFVEKTDKFLESCRIQIPQFQFADNEDSIAREIGRLEQTLLRKECKLDPYAKQAVETAIRVYEDYLDQDIELNLMLAGRRCGLCVCMCGYMYMFA